VDLEVPLAALTLPDVEGLACLEPTGMANPVPRLAARGLKVLRQGVRGPQGQHLWLELAQADGGPSVEAIGFNMGGLHPVGERVDAVFTPVAERWHGKQRLQLKLAAIGALA
jgi:single-stranded-DNA-specific exonuclease